MTASKEHWLAHAFHIVDAIKKIEHYATNDAATLFNPETIAYDGLLRLLQTLSDASQQLPQDIKSQHPAINWRNIAGFRNILAHNYLGELDEGILRRIVFEELPKLSNALEQHIPK